MKSKFITLIMFFIGFSSSIAQWKSISLPTDITIIKDIQIVSDTIIFAVGIIDNGRFSDRESYLLKSKDFGDNWDVIKFPNNGLEINKIDFLNTQAGIATGNLKSQNKSIILKTFNGGEGWNTGWTTPDTLQTIVNDFKYVNDNYCIASIRCYYKDYSIFLKSNTGGNSYEGTLFNKILLDKIAVKSDSVFYFNAGNIEMNLHTILVTNDLGDSFDTISTSLSLGDGISSNVISFISVDDNNLYIGGTDILMDSRTPILLKSTDNGNNWEKTKPFSSGGIFAMKKDMNNNVFYYCGSLGHLDIETVNKGFIATADKELNNWKNEPLSNNIISIQKICISDRIKIAHSSSNILVQDSTAVISVKENNNSIHFYILSQNYPNPFNPSTKIKYTIAKSPLLGGDGRGGFVTLKVYDILGSEIKTLVNKTQNAGSYEVDFDASGLSSGIYFYKLQSGSFTETKKMLLLR